MALVPLKKPAPKKGRARVSPGRRSKNGGHGATAAKLGGVLAIAKRMEGWHRPDQALVRIESVPTVFPWLDRELGIGGWPIARIGVIHGPAHHGKTTLLLGLLKSFLTRGHYAGFLDAERTADEAWMKTMLQKFALDPRFFARRPKSFEHAVDLCRSFCRTLEDARKAGDVPPETRGILALDSLSKLVPQNLLDDLSKKGAEEVGVDGFSGAAGRMIAAMNGQWFRELTILLDESKVSFVAIGRERDNPEKKRGPFHRTWKLGGGRDVEFEASILGRVTRDFVKVGSLVVAQRHEVKIRKNKAGHLDEPVVAVFHTTAEGFDPARDVAELALKLGVLRKDKAGRRSVYLTEDGEVIDAADQEALVAELRNDSLRGMVEEACRNLR